MSLVNRYRSTTRKRTGGTLHYEGDTPLDKVYAMSDLLSEAGRGLGHKEARTEYLAVSKALFALEKAILKVHPEWKPKI
jgi:hypothetical protein